MKRRELERYWHRQRMMGTHNKCCSRGGEACGGCVYFLGVIGAAVFYIQQSATFWQGVVGVLKALVWPAFLIHKLLGL